MGHLDSKAIRHLIDFHREAIATLEAEIADRPAVPEPLGGFPPVVRFTRTMPGLQVSDPQVDRPFVAVGYAPDTWFINRGGGAPSGPLTWDSLLDWIGVENWNTVEQLCTARECGIND